jgi:hypothetical protein
MAVPITGACIDRYPLAGLDHWVYERAARRELRAQIDRLERELDQSVVDGFPHLRAPAPIAARRARSRHGGAGARLLSLGELERTRDELAGMLQTARRALVERAELERGSRELLERMRREPARYKFVRLPVRDLGEGSCGVWEVRPRLGPIGMLAGWWRVKLSSGCPLAGGHAVAAWPDFTDGSDRGGRSHRRPGLPPRREPRVVR